MNSTRRTIGERSGLRFSCYHSRRVVVFSMKNSGCFLSAVSYVYLGSRHSFPGERSGWEYKNLAEGGRFELPVGFSPLALSRRVH